MQRKLASNMKYKILILTALTISIFLMTPFALLISFENEGDAGQFVVTSDEDDVFEGYVAITNVQELSDIRNNLSGNYYLANDIVFDEEDGIFQPIGNGPNSNNWFVGILDGNGHVIDGLHTVVRIGSGTASSGLFGYIGNGAQIKNIGIVNGSSFAESIYSSESVNATIAYAGGIAGYAASSSLIINCYNTGSVTASASSYGHTRAYAGGMVGNSGTVNITNCYNTGSISTSSLKMGFSFTAPESTAASGGVLGYAEGQSLLTNCYNTGSISTLATANANAVAGGILGADTSFESTQIVNCYNVGFVSATSTQSKESSGGILGYTGTTPVKMTNCYATEPLCGYGSPTVDSGISTPERRENSPDQRSIFAKSLVQMKPSLSDAKNNNSVYFTGMTDDILGWDFDTVWTINSKLNGGFPILQSLEDSIPDDILVTGVEVTGEDGATTITAKGGKLQLFASLLPANATCSTVSWSLINETRIAYIDSNGLLTAQTNGAVVVRATANDNSEVYGELTITISGQSILPMKYTVIYYANGVQGTTAFVNYAESKTIYHAASSTIFSPPSEKQFKEWNTQPDGRGTSYNPGQSITVVDNMDLFAIWKNIPTQPSIDPLTLGVIVIAVISGIGVIVCIFSKGIK